jgi:hypothetical protein
MTYLDPTEIGNSIHRWRWRWRTRGFIREFKKCMSMTIIPFNKCQFFLSHKHTRYLCVKFSACLKQLLTRLYFAYCSGVRR